MGERGGVRVQRDRGAGDREREVGGKEGEVQE